MRLAGVGVNTKRPPSAAAYWSTAGFALGVRLAFPLAPGMLTFGIAVGATAARKGFGFLDNLLMNGLI